MVCHQCFAAGLENTLMCMRWMPFNASLVAFRPAHHSTVQLHSGLSRLQFFVSADHPTSHVRSEVDESGLQVQGR